MLANQITPGLDRLTPKERACLLLVAHRRSSKQIAAELGIAKTSVDTYCNRARTKLGVANRYEAARLALALAGGAENRAPRHIDGGHPRSCWLPQAPFSPRRLRWDR